MLRRRHHCRACGQLFCRECTNNRVELPSFGYRASQRVCDQCFKTHRPDRVLGHVGDNFVVKNPDVL